MADQPKPPRAILASFPAEYSLPAKPSRARAQVLDAHRQTGFLLGEELALFERMMNLQLRIVAANAKVRGPRAAALFTLWSRSFGSLSDACALMTGGSYASCATLARVVLDAIAVQRSLIADGLAEYEEWFAEAVSQDREHAAIQIDIGHYKAASVLVSDQRLGELYRLLMDLSLPHFGSALLLAAAETSLQKVPVAFADNSFHFGWAQLASGWLLLLAGEQIAAALGSGVFTADEAITADAADIQRRIEDVLADKRCYVEHLGMRFVFHNFRRAPSGQPKRLTLGSP